jgi:hypothetical protein
MNMAAFWVVGSVDWQKFTDVSKLLATSTIRAIA